MRPCYPRVQQQLQQKMSLAQHTVHFAASEHPDAKDRSSGGFSLTHPRLASASG